MNTLTRIANPLRRTGTAAVAFPALAAASARFMASKTVFVGNLSWSARHDDLRRLFEAYGPLENVRLMTERETGRSRGFGFVTFAEEANADKALKELDGKDFHGRPLRVSLFQVFYHLLLLRLVWYLLFAHSGKLLHLGKRVYL